jgi:hypothetical protein
MTLLCLYWWLSCVDKVDKCLHSLTFVRARVHRPLLCERSSPPTITPKIKICEFYMRLTHSLYHRVFLWRSFGSLVLLLSAALLAADA